MREIRGETFVRLIAGDADCCCIGQRCGEVRTIWTGIGYRGCRCEVRRKKQKEFCELRLKLSTLVR